MTDIELLKLDEFFWQEQGFFIMALSSRQRLSSEYSEFIRGLLENHCNPLAHNFARLIMPSKHRTQTTHQPLASETRSSVSEPFNSTAGDVLVGSHFTKAAR